MTERVARDCSSGVLETTSNRLWSAAKTNTHQLLQKKGGERGREGRGEARGGKWKKGRFSNKIEMYVRGSQGLFGWLTKSGSKKKRTGETCAYRKNPLISNIIGSSIVIIFWQLSQMYLGGCALLSFTHLQHLPVSKSASLTTLQEQVWTCELLHVKSGVWAYKTRQHIGM